VTANLAIIGTIPGFQLAAAIAPNRRIPVALPLEGYVSAIRTIESDIVVHIATHSISPGALHGFWVAVLVAPDGDLPVTFALIAQPVATAGTGTEMTDFVIDKSTGLALCSTITTLNLSRTGTPDCYVPLTATLGRHTITLVCQAAIPDLAIVRSTYFTAGRAISR